MGGQSSSGSYGTAARVRHFSDLDEYGQCDVVDFTMAEANGPDAQQQKRRFMDQAIQLLDVALTEDLPERGLRRGQVGTVVEDLAPGVFEVEFSDNQGRTY